MGQAGIAAAGRIEHRGVPGAAPAHEVEQGVAVAVAECTGIKLVALAGADPAFLRQHHGHRFAGDQCGLIDGLRRFARHQRRQTGIAEFLGIGLQFVLQQFFQFGVGAERGDDLFQFGGQFGLFAADFHLFKAGQLFQFGLEDVLGLVLAQFEAGDQCGFRLVFGADDVDDFIEIEEGDEQAFQQVQATFQFFLAVGQTLTQGIHAERQPFIEQRLQMLDLRTAIEADDVEIDPVALFQIGGGEQVSHQRIDIDPVRTRHQYQPGRSFMIGLVAQVFQPRQFLGAHLLCNLLHHFRRRDLVGQCGQHDIAVFLDVGGAGADRTAAAFVHRDDFAARRDDFGLARVVRSEHVFAQIAHAGLRVVEQADAGADHLIEVVWRNVGGHADRDAGSAVQQDVRQARRQPGRFLQRTVEVRVPVHRALAEFAQQHFGNRRQFGFGVTHGGEGLRIIGGTEVALALNQRVTIGERLRHEHHGFVTGGIAVRVIFTDDITDRTRRFLRLGGGVQRQLAHRKDDSALDRLQAVAEKGQSAVEHDIHRIIEVGAFGIFTQGNLFETVEAGAGQIGHGGLVVRMFSF